MKNRSKNQLSKEAKNLIRSENGSYASVIDDLYYSHLLELLFDQGSGKDLQGPNQISIKNKKQINNIKTKRSIK